MRDIIIEVGYQYVYDLYYRVRNACLQHTVYRLDFADWIKAGLAFNALGTSVPGRHPAYFGKLYTALLDGDITIGLEQLREAVMNFYIDIFNLYQDHLLAQLQCDSEQRNVAPSDLLIIPSFSQVDKVKEFLPSCDIEISEYECKYPDDLLQEAATLFYTESEILYHGLSLMFDYGVKKEGKGVILEVR